MRRAILRTSVVVLLLAASTFAQSSSSAVFGTPNADIEKRISDLLSKMTLEEKVGQINQYSAGQPTGPGTGRSNYDELVSAGQVGSLFNVTGAKETNQFQRIAMEKSRLKIPLLFGLDVIHGYRTIFPVPLALSATWDPALVERASRIAAQEASAEGVRWTFSPMVDIARDARGGRITEGAGADPYLGSLMARAYVRGYQGTGPMDPTSIAACAKHYVGYGAAEGGRDYNTTEIPERLLREVYLPPFHSAQQAGAMTFMSAFNSLNEVPASANAFTINQVLKKEWKFQGFVVSDWGSIAELMAHGIANDSATAARKALLAGVDMDMEGSAYIRNMAALVKSGAVPQAALDEAVRRILRVKFALGLFDHPYADESKPVSRTLDPAHLDVARQAAEESFVLLKNDANTLPLKSAKTIALVGPLADSQPDMLGSWAAKGNPADAVTLRTALSQWAKQNGARVNYAKGADVLGASSSDFSQAVEAARSADVVIAAVGENAGWMSGEAASRTRLDPPGNQQQMLEAVAQAGKPLVLVVFAGRPLELRWAKEHAAAIVYAWFPGVQAGPALARALTGATGFSGRLTVDLPRSVGQMPLYYNHLSTGRPADHVDQTKPPTSDSDKYLSRYIDEQNSPLYPFGFGLTYSAFTYSPVRLSASTVSAATMNSGSGTITVTADVKNTGAQPATEVVQLYIRQTGTSVARPVRELKGFQRITLAPGESKTLNFQLTREDLAFWNIDMKQVVEPAKVTVWVAPDSVSGAGVDLTINQ